jgi:hypothetical protein
MTGFRRVVICGLFLLLSGAIPSRAGAQVIGKINRYVEATRVP